MNLCESNQRAFTVIELSVLLGVVILLLLVLIPSMAKTRRTAQLIDCENDLKYVGLAFRLWVGDGDRFAMSVSTNQGGTLEVSNDVWRTFLVMSNELEKPGILTCPSDNRTCAKSWEALVNSNISYFVCLEADEALPNMFLSGDRDLTTLRPVSNRIMTLTSNETVSWDSNLHSKCGNIGLADGSVQQMKSDQLNRQVVSSIEHRGESYRYLTNKPPATLRLAIPD
jgi:competence protein ComGC